MGFKWTDPPKIRHSCQTPTRAKFRAEIYHKCRHCSNVRAVLACRSKQSRRAACRGPWRSSGILSGGRSSRQPHCLKKLLQLQKLPAWRKLAPGQKTPQPGSLPGPPYARCTPIHLCFNRACNLANSRVIQI